MADKLEEKIKECRSEVDSALALLHGRVDDFAIASQSIGDIKRDVEEMREIIEAWNSAKGFVSTIKFLSAFIKWTSITGGFVGLIWYIVHFGKLPPE